MQPNNCFMCRCFIANFFETNDRPIVLYGAYMALLPAFTIHTHTAGMVWCRSLFHMSQVQGCHTVIVVNWITMTFNQIAHLNHRIEHDNSAQRNCNQTVVVRQSLAIKFVMKKKNRVHDCCDVALTVGFFPVFYFFHSGFWILK